MVPSRRWRRVWTACASTARWPPISGLGAGYAYHEAADGLDGIQIAVNAPDRARLGLAQALSRTLALWDDFDHAGALDRIKAYASRVQPCCPAMLPALQLLTHESDSRNEAARLSDLWLNAERRAAQGRFDDAVARVYRLIEWTAQWQLRIRLGADYRGFPP